MIKFYTFLVLFLLSTAIVAQNTIDGNLDESEQDYIQMSGEMADNPLAFGLPKFIGCCYASHSKANFEKYWNQVVPENAGKWGSAEPVRDVFSWGSLDEAYNFAAKNGFPYRHHVLVWGNQQPTWIENLSTGEQLEEIEEWFMAVAERYPNIEFLEVVNEALHDPPNQAGNGGGNYIAALGGKGSTGYDWIIEAFRLARKHFPETTKLMINEYGLTDNSNNVREYKKIIELLKKEDLIDAVGIQGHAFNTTGSAATIKSNLDLLAQVNLPIYVTEMDIDGATDDAQLASYKKIFPVFWEHPAVKGITLWGFRSGMWRTDQKAYLLSPSGAERPALTWLREYLRATVSAREIELNNSYTLFPNPVTQRMLNITGVEGILGIRIFDASGKMVKSIVANKETVIAFYVDFQPGIYIVQLMSDQKTTTRKIVVK
jgi:endo-1,4-beta-xylanase